MPDFGPPGNGGPSEPGTAPGGPGSRNPLLRCSPAELRKRTSAKWTFHPPDVLPLWVAEMDVPLAEPVAEALRTAVDLGDTGYASGPTGYAEAADVFARERWGTPVPAQGAALVADVMAGVVEVLKLVTAPGDAVVVNPPVYAPFYPFVTHLGRRAVDAPLTAGHRIDLAALESAFATATEGGRDRAAYLLSSPHNPTGTVHTAEELTAVARLARAYGVRVVADEIHAPLVLPGAHHVPYLSLPGTERDFAVLSASKGWNLAGLKAALVVPGADSVTDLARMPAEVGHGPSHLGVLAHCAAFRYGGDWLSDLLAGLADNRELLADLLSRHLPEVRWLPPDGTYFAWLDCRALGLGDDPAAAFLERGRVAFVSGPSFGEGGAGHIRLNFAAAPEMLEEAVRRMAATAAAS